jgi:RNA recognition motif-containing protein
VKNIFVGNLDFSTSQDEIHSLFEDFGAVDRVNLIKDRETGQSRGFAFVEMPNDEEADVAISQLNGAQLGRRKIRVNEARPQEGGPRGPRPGGGGGGGYNRGPRPGGGGGGGGYIRGGEQPRPSGGGSGQWWDE